MTYISVGAVILTVCSWITVPFAVPFTMQTFAVFALLLVTGGKKGTASILLHLLIGCAGLPVFSGFGGGFSHLLGPTGGYLVGFLLTGILYMIFEKTVKGKRTVFTVLLLASGLLLCYVCGTVWFAAVYGSEGEKTGFAVAVSTCVLPYVLPDSLKLALAVQVGKRLQITS